MDVLCRELSGTSDVRHTQSYGESDDSDAVSRSEHEWADGSSPDVQSGHTSAVWRAQFGESDGQSEVREFLSFFLSRQNGWLQKPKLKSFALLWMADEVLIFGASLRKSNAIQAGTKQKASMEHGSFFTQFSLSDIEVRVEQLNEKSVAKTTTNITGS